jgi:hypothetical protein
MSENEDREVMSDRAFTHEGFYTFPSTVYANPEPPAAGSLFDDPERLKNDFDRVRRSVRPRTADQRRKLAEDVSTSLKEIYADVVAKREHPHS